MKSLLPSMIVAAVAAVVVMTAFADPESNATPPTPSMLSTTFRVVDFGAACDGKTDDTAAVQKAINAAEASGGGAVEFPKGTCLLNSCHLSRHPWFFYNLMIGSNVTLSGTAGTRLLQGPGGRHPLVPGASQVRNTVLAFGADYTTIRFQDPKYNGGFFGLKPTMANRSAVTLSTPSDALRFQSGDYVAIYQSTIGDVIPTEFAQLTSVDQRAGVLGLRRALSRSFAAPCVARVSSIVTTNVGVRNMTVQGTEPLAVTEAVGFAAENNHFVIDTSIGDNNVTGLNLNTLVDFEFRGNTITSVGPRYANLELTQRNSRNGLFVGNTFSGANMGFGEYAAHVIFTNNQFWIHPDLSVVAGIFLGGKDIEFVQNNVHCGKITGGSGWGVVLADLIGPAEYAPYVGQVRIANNKLEFEAADNACIGIFAPDTSVIGNTIVAHGSALGIHAEGPLRQSNVFKDNTISMGTGDGILVVIPGTGGSGTVVTGNTINGSGVRGIHINAHGAPSAGGAVVSDNKIVGFKKPVDVD